MSELRVGVIGLGVMGKNHARVLRTVAGVRVIGACDPFAGDEDIPIPVFRSFDELLSHGPDYCVVAVPTSHHFEVGMTLANAGVSALIEKPVAIDMASANTLATAFRSAGLVAGVGHVERYNPALREAQRRIALGELGELIQISTVRQGPFPGRLQDVGVALDLATHDVDLTSWIAQSGYRAVGAYASRLSDHEHEDLLTVVGQLRNGVVVNHVINWLSPKKERRTLVTGTRGVFQIDTLSSDLIFYENGSVPNEWNQVAQFRGITQGNIIQYAFPKREPLLLEHEAFRDAVLGVGSDIVTLDEGARTLEVALGALTSARLGETVEV